MKNDYLVIRTEFKKGNSSEFGKTFVFMKKEQTGKQRLALLLKLLIFIYKNLF